ncbi:MAG: DUF2164 domain-containing protein [Bacillota bacterium]
MQPHFDISKEVRDRMVSLIKEYFLEERGIELGDLAASMVLDFFVRTLAPEFYNQGVYDAYRYLLEKAEDVLSLQK